MSKKTDGWMPLYLADYLADTSRLTTEQHGAYMLIIMDYWRNGPPPNDDGVLASICRLSPASWRKHKPTIAGFFTVVDGRLTQKRIDAERQKAIGITETRGSAGAAGAASKWGTAPGKTSGKTPAQLRSERLSEARKRGSHTPAEWSVLLDVLGHVCVSCFTPADQLQGGALCKDHIKPIYQGGDDSIMNLQPMCRSCNSSKGSDSSDLRANAKAGWLDALEKRLAKRLANDQQTSAPTHTPFTNTSLGTPTDVAKDQDGLNTHSAGVCFEPPSAGEVCKAMRAAGLPDANPGNQKLRTLLDAGAEKAEFVAAAEKAAAEGKGFAYALGIVANARIQAAQLAAQIHRGPMPAAAPNKQEALEQRNRQIADEWAAQGA